MFYVDIHDEFKTDFTINHKSITILNNEILTKESPYEDWIYFDTKITNKTETNYTSLSIDTENSDVIIKKGESFEIHYKGELKGNSYPRIIKSVVQKAISLKADNDRATKRNTQLIITMPNDLISVIIYTKKGTIKIEDNLNIKGLDLKTIEGDIHLNCTSSKMHIISNYGKIKMG